VEVSECIIDGALPGWQVFVDRKFKINGIIYLVPDITTKLCVFSVFKLIVKAILS